MKKYIIIISILLLFIVIHAVYAEEQSKPDESDTQEETNPEETDTFYQRAQDFIIHYSGEKDCPNDHSKQHEQLDPEPFLGFVSEEYPRPTFGIQLNALAFQGNILDHREQIFSPLFELKPKMKIDFSKIDNFFVCEGLFSFAFPGNSYEIDFMPELNHCFWYYSNEFYKANAEKDKNYYSIRLGRTYYSSELNFAFNQLMDGLGFDVNVPKREPNFLDRKIGIDKIEDKNNKEDSIAETTFFMRSFLGTPALLNPNYHSLQTIDREEFYRFSKRLFYHIGLGLQNKEWTFVNNDYSNNNKNFDLNHFTRLFGPYDKMDWGYSNIVGTKQQVEKLIINKWYIPISGQLPFVRGNADTPFYFSNTVGLGYKRHTYNFDENIQFIFGLEPLFQFGKTPNGGQAQTILAFGSRLLINFIDSDYDDNIKTIPVVYNTEDSEKSEDKEESKSDNQDESKENEKNENNDATIEIQNGVYKIKDLLFDIIVTTGEKNRSSIRISDTLSQIDNQFFSFSSMETGIVFNPMLANLSKARLEFGYSWDYERGFLMQLRLSSHLFFKTSPQGPDPSLAHTNHNNFFVGSEFDVSYFMNWHQFFILFVQGGIFIPNQVYTYNFRSKVTLGFSLYLETHRKTEPDDLPPATKKENHYEEMDDLFGIYRNH